ncbi:asparagine synthase [Amycolatopsis sp. NBRC 101858]|uniref:lasso peptide isopeptide bond-forming cyclase n=1 Tax=Amycolatopsis sp. NBRC 101858 TaxID=3032200 RepID=UPI0024A14660|nr:lasso peptide isopeptide bond-forming cyclase [Amycolatopsis sp. NBRC 101858]GLY38386.1 asparagine synthase [Amycolatopsis sp. NBRC 101858]
MSLVGCWTRATGLAHVVSRTLSASLREAGSRDGTLFLIGHSFVPDSQLAQACEAISRSNDVGATDGWPGCHSSLLITRSGAVLLADPVGQFPLFVAEKADAVWFGTDSSDLARLAGGPLDEISVAAILACPESGEPVRGRSMYRGIHRVPAGHVLSIGRAGLRERPYSVLRPEPEMTMAESAERLRAALSTAVRARTLSPYRWTFDLSGGLDSTSLTVLAAGELGELDSFTSVNPAAPVTDDIEFAGRHARSVTGIRHHLVPAGPRHLPYQVLRPTGDWPHGSSLATGALRTRLARAVEFGSQAHLTGEGGDVVLKAPAAYLADLARHGELTRLWSDCVAWARLRGRTPLALVSRAVTLSRTTRRRALDSLAEDVAAGRPVGAESWEADRIAYWRRPSAQWLTPAARRSLAAHIRETADHLAEDDDLDAGDVVTQELVRQQTLTLRTVRAVGAEFGVEVHAPFMDTEVVRACLALPARRRADPRTPKPLLRAALSGLVPPAVLARTTKGDYTRGVYLGVRRAAPVLRRMLTESVAADHGILEPGPVREVLEGAIQGMPTPWGALHQVFAVEAWLREREEGVRP